MILKDLDSFLNFRPKFNAVGCYLVQQGHILLLKRHHLKPQGGLWCVPGGKMEAGESVLEAAVREFKQETGLDLPQNLDCRISCPLPVAVRYPNYDFFYFMLKVETTAFFWNLVLNPAEHTEFTWVPLLSLIAQQPVLSLVPDEGECLRRLLQK